MNNTTGIRISNSIKAGNEDTDTRLRELTHDLIERIKELNCLYGISRLVEKENVSLNDILQGVVNLIPPAWQYPAVTCARINLEDKQYKTSNFKETRWQQTESVIVNGRQVGTLEIYYTEEKPFAYEGPFLKEERDLIHGIAERLGRIIESKIAESTLKKLYNREQKLYKKLQIEMQNRIDFTRLLVHELKTPLTALVATSQLLVDETHDMKLGKLAGFVLEGANNLNNRINDLQDVTRGEIGKLKLKQKSLILEEFLPVLVEESTAYARQYGVTIRLRIKGRPLPDIYVDEERIRQVIFNLINNACKYASEGKIIVISAVRDRFSPSVIIGVKDNGPGIPKEKIRMLFKPGYQISGRGDISSRPRDRFNFV